MRLAGILFLVFSVGGTLTGCGGAGTTPSGVLSITPTISTISPTSSAPNGTITITGTNLAGTYTQVLFNGPMVSNVFANSGGSTSVTAVVPSQFTPGSYNVSVIDTDADGDVSSASNSVQINLL
jgi:hypothetical protein